MKSFLGVLLLYLLFTALLIALGIGFGFVLHWILPAVDIGICILIGVVASGMALYLLMRFYDFLEGYAEEKLILDHLEEIAPPPPREKRQRRKSK